MVVACCTANDRDARADLVEKSRLVMLPQHHSLDLLAETLKVYQLIWFIRLLCHQLGTAVAIISDEAREHIDEVIVIRRGVADGDASVDESELPLCGNQDVSWVQVPVNKIVLKHHLYDGIDALIAQCMLRRLVGFFVSPGQERDAVNERLHEQVRRAVMEEWLWEHHIPRALCSKISPEGDQVLCLLSEVELHREHAPKLFEHALGIEPLHLWQNV
mmetsp:Transcript_46526/g.104880  ORF Transcript_46526/g.104880 Transcript_46526/m.104880 type:complete len:217 (+) Transcript_46526:651-1301(+)